MSSALGVAGGMAILLGAGGALASCVYLAGLWREAAHPPRRSMGWALARGLPAHPEALGLTARESLVRAEGCTVPAWYIEGGGGADAPVVVMLHGHGRSRWDMLRRVGPWFPHASVLVLADLRGHGDASGRSALGRREAADVCALLAEVRARLPHTRIELVGHSMGAVIAIHAAAQCERAGSPLARVHAFGPYETARTPFQARLHARALPARPFSDGVLSLFRFFDGPELATSTAARQLAHTPLEVSADALDEVSPVADARAIAAAAPHGRLHLTSGIAHSDLGLSGPA